MKICNLGCIGVDGLTIALDDIVCLVGANNSGKSTVLRAYEAAVEGKKLTEEEFHGVGKREAVTVELWVHIPHGTENIDEKWKEKRDDLLLVRSLWTWEAPDSAPVRKTWNPEANEYAEDGKAAGLDNVFNSRLPKAFRIGSLENPEEEHEKLLKLVLEPVIRELKAASEKPDSDLKRKLEELKVEANRPLEPFREQIAQLTTKLNKSYQRVFGTAEVALDLSLGDLGVDIPAALTRASSVKINEADGVGHWSRQGTGSQRALFWSMLEIRSELKRLADYKDKSTKELKALDKKVDGAVKKLAKAKTEKSIQECKAEIAALQVEFDAKKAEVEKGNPTPDDFLPGHMLLIDEPETALHPSAIRGARDHLYRLAAESGWQVIITTHHPAFVDPAKDHTTIVRVQREARTAAPKVYRSDTLTFSPEEKQQLKSLLAFDLDLAEMFFGSSVVVVEGDTEYACFNAIMDADSSTYPVERRPLIVRARGKATIPLIIRMLQHFKVDFAVLHDIDPKFTSDGGKANPAYSVNSNIATAVSDARKAGLKVIHRCSCPNFEISHAMNLPTKDKPISAWQNIQQSAAARTSVQSVLDDLRRGIDSAAEANDGATYEASIDRWVAASGVTDACYVGATAKR